MTSQSGRLSGAPRNDAEEGFLWINEIVSPVAFEELPGPTPLIAFNNVALGTAILFRVARSLRMASLHQRLRGPLRLQFAVRPRLCAGSQFSGRLSLDLTFHLWGRRQVALRSDAEHGGTRTRSLLRPALPEADRRCGLISRSSSRPSRTIGHMSTSMKFRHDPRGTVDRLLEKFVIPLEPEH